MQLSAPEQEAVLDHLESCNACVQRVEALSAKDTLVDLMGAFWLLHGLGINQVYSSALPAPRGRKDAMPLPAPASIRVLEGTGAIFEATDETRELVTPTGAAILASGAVFERPAIHLLPAGDTPHRTAFTDPAGGAGKDSWTTRVVRIEGERGAVEIPGLDDQPSWLIFELAATQ